jgi:hypothetical protein
LHIAAAMAMAVGDNPNREGSDECLNTTSFC